MGLVFLLGLFEMRKIYTIDKVRLLLAILNLNEFRISFFHLLDTGDDDLMDLDGSKKDDVKPIVSKSKGKHEEVTSKALKFIMP